MIYSVRQIYEKIKHVLEEYQIEKIVLFGSYANGTATEKSDVDLVVDYGEYCRGLKCIQFQRQLEEVLEKEVDVVNIKQVPLYLVEDVLKEGVLLYENQQKRKTVSGRDAEIQSGYSKLTRSI